MQSNKGNCPLGGDESHFDNKEDAQAFIDNEMENKHGLLGETSRTSVKSVYLETGDGPYDTNWVNEYAEAVKNGTEKSKFKVISK